MQCELPVSVGKSCLMNFEKNLHKTHMLHALEVEIDRFAPTYTDELSFETTELKVHDRSLSIKIVNVSYLSEGWLYWAEWRTDGMTERNGGIHGISYNTKYTEYTKRPNLHNIKKKNGI